MNARIFERTWVQGEIYQKPDNLYNYAFQGEAAADTFIIDGKTKAGDVVSITGTITGVYLGENKVSVPLSGEVENGKAVLTLDAACYTIPGKFTVSIYAQNNGERICIYCGIGYMFRTQSETVVYPSTAIPDIQELVEEAQEVIASIPEDYSTLSAHFPSSGRLVAGSGSATNPYSVATGVSTKARGMAAHAEGNGSISDNFATHAEGDATTALGSASHAEGKETISGGSASHAEGYKTNANGTYSHSEGAGTISNRKSQHVFGEYNIEDTGGNSASQRGDYIEVVGNGSSSEDRSNARTLDWNGNEEIAGDITINKGSANEMTIGEAIQALRQAIIALGGNL